MSTKKSGMRYHFTAVKGEFTDLDGSITAKACFSDHISFWTTFPSGDYSSHHNPLVNTAMVTLDLDIYDDPDQDECPSLGHYIVLAEKNCASNESLYSLWFNVSDETFTFAFETEEEALMFKMKL